MISPLWISEAVTLVIIIFFIKVYLDDLVNKNKLLPCFIMFFFNEAKGTSQAKPKIDPKAPENIDVDVDVDNDGGGPLDSDKPQKKLKIRNLSNKSNIHDMFIKYVDKSPIRRVDFLSMFSYAKEYKYMPVFYKGKLYLVNEWYWTWNEDKIEIEYFARPIVITPSEIKEILFVNNSEQIQDWREFGDWYFYKCYLDDNYLYFLEKQELLVSSEKKILAFESSSYEKHFVPVFSTSIYKPYKLTKIKIGNLENSPISASSPFFPKKDGEGEVDTSGGESGD